jgi:hypothetical protein
MMMMMMMDTPGGDDDDDDDGGGDGNDDGEDEYVWIWAKASLTKSQEGGVKTPLFLSLSLCPVRHSPTYILYYTARLLG